MGMEMEQGHVSKGLYSEYYLYTFRVKSNQTCQAAGLGRLGGIMQENILSVETDPIVMHIYIVQPAFFPLIAAALVQLPINSSQAQPACQPGPAPPIGLAPCSFLFSRRACQAGQVA